MTPLITMPTGVVDLIARLTVAAFLGAAIGYERDLHGRAAGLRTQLLVSVGSALFMLISLALSDIGNGVVTDPGRVAAQVVTGIGFLGAGVILKQGVTVRGLTTAACLWATAAIGMAAGGGMYWVSILTCAMTMLTLVGLKYYERTMTRELYRRVTVSTRQDIELSRLSDIMRETGLKVLAYDLSRDFKTGLLTARFDVRMFHKGTTEKIAQKVIDALRDAQIEVDHFSWRR
jgi:putative Mg2+ transporter-C (MgtC) family protein